MIERYIIFNTEKLLKEYNQNKEVLKSLQDQYHNLDGTSAIDYSLEKVTSSKAPDGLEKLTIERVRLRDKIDDYRRDLNRIDSVLNLLSVEERVCLQEFFIRNQSKTAALVSLGEMLHLEKTAIYDLRRQALERFERLIFG